MEIRKGETRVVVLLPLLGLAIKFPRIRLIMALNLFRRLMKREGRWKKIKQHWQYSPKAIIGFKSLLFRGVIANWKEFLFYQQTKNCFLHPTHLSIFGLVNIQPLGKSFLMSYVDLGRQLNILTEGKIYLDAHCFVNPRNFCEHDGKLKIIDYGSDGAQEVILEYGEKIYQSFDFSYTFPTQESDT